MKIAILTTDNREHFRNYGPKTPYFGAAPEALLQGMAGLSEAEVHVISCTQRPIVSPPKLAENIFFHSLVVPKIGWMRTGYQGCIRAVRKKLKEIQPDIVHGQGTERDCAISAVFSGFPNVVTIHGNMAELARLFDAKIGSYQWLAGKLEDFTLPRTRGVFCNSEYTEKLVKARGCRTWRVPNPIQKAFFASQNSSYTGVCRLLNIGVISPRKRQLELLHLARNLFDRGLHFELNFIGSASMEDSYAARFLGEIAKEKERGYVSYVGVKTTSELIKILDQSSGLLHFPTEEAFGLVVAEALTRNLKLFGSRTGGIIDVAAEVNGAELFECNDWDGLENSVSSWISQGAPRLNSAAELMRKRYAPEVIAQRHLEIYREVVR